MDEVLEFLASRNHHWDDLLDKSPAFVRNLYRLAIKRSRSEFALDHLAQLRSIRVAVASCIDSKCASDYKSLEAKLIDAANGVEKTPKDAQNLLVKRLLAMGVKKA